MELAKAIEQMKSYASKNKAAHDVFTQFGTRHRTRNQITVKGLALAMRRSGFNHDAQEYARVIELLGAVGLGQVRHTKSGNVIGVFGIKQTLQSIGRAVIDGERTIKNFAPRNKYSPIKESLKTLREEPKAKQVIETQVASIDSLIREILGLDTVSAEKRVKVVRELLEK